MQGHLKNSIDFYSDGFTAAGEVYIFSIYKGSFCIFSHGSYLQNVLTAKALETFA